MKKEHGNTKIFYLISNATGSIYAGTLADFMAKLPEPLSNRQSRQEKVLNSLKRIIYKRSTARWYALRLLSDPSAVQVKGAKMLW